MPIVEPIYLERKKDIDLCNREECEECAFHGQGKGRMPLPMKGDN